MKFDDNPKEAELVMQLCEAIIDSKLYNKLWAHDFISQLISYEIVHKFILRDPEDSKYIHFQTHQE